MQPDPRMLGQPVRGSAMLVDGVIVQYEIQLAVVAASDEFEEDHGFVVAVPRKSAAIDLAGDDSARRTGWWRHDRCNRGCPARPAAAEAARWGVRCRA